LSRKYDATPESAKAITTGHSRLIRPSPSSRDHTPTTRATIAMKSRMRRPV
jgi:hypothetical protein